MSDSRSSGTMSDATTVPLIGTVAEADTHASPGRIRSGEGPGADTQSVVIPTHEFYGNLDERLDLPSEWDLNVMHMRGYGTPPLTDVELERDLARPIGTRPLREIAAGRKRVVITFDDLTRATPTYAVVPWVIRELQAAGVPDAGILFLGSFATHRPMTALEVQRKIGKEYATRFAWLNHSPFYGTKELGTTSFGNVIRINQTFMDADLKITLSGIKVHYDAGYGGGAKAVMPGLAHIESIEFNHNVLLRQTKTAGPVRVFHNEMRQDLIEGARMAGVDFSVQIMYDEKLRPIRVFSGDVVEAHHAASRVASQTYCTPTYRDADIVISNAYPQNAQAFHAQRWIGHSLKPQGGTGVLVIQHPLTLDPVHFLNNRSALKDGASYFELVRRWTSRELPKDTGLIVFTQYMSQTLKNNYPAGTHFSATWDDVIKTLRVRHPGSGVHVALYPYGGMQHQELELDE